MKLSFKERLFGSIDLKSIGNYYTGSSSYSLINTDVNWTANSQQTTVTDGYAGNDIIYSIINLITNKAKIAPWGLYTIKDEGSYKQFKALTTRPDLVQDWRQVEKLRTKSLEPFTGNDKFLELLQYPNNEDTWSDLIEQWCGFKLITGNSFIKADLLEAGANGGKPNSLYAMPSQWTDILVNRNTWPVPVVGYRLNGYGVPLQFTTEEVLLDKYWNPANPYRGLSPLEAAFRTVTRSNESKKASVANYQNGGPKGVLYVDDPRYNPDAMISQASALKEKMREYSGSDKANQIATSGYKVGWQALGLNNVDLAIIESEKHDLRGLCNIYGVPSQLLNDPENKSYNNQLEAEKALTSRITLPLLVSIRDNINRKLHTDWGYSNEKNICVDFDTSVYPELQESKVELMKFAMNWIFPIRKQYELMGEDIPDYLNEQDLEKIYVPSGFVPLEELNVPAIDVAAMGKAGYNPYENG